MDDGLRIIELRAENILRLKAISIKPEGNVIVVGGQNGAGKTSVLNSIMYCLAGASSLPPKPVRDGQDEATIRVDLGEIIATRTIYPDGSSVLKLTDKDGGKHSSPQTILDSIRGKLTFDPIEFSRMDPKKQAETLKSLVGLDFTALDRKKATKSEDRVLIGREVKALKGQIEGLPQHAEAPTTEVSVAELSQKLAQARAVNKANQCVRQDHFQAVQVADQWGKRVEDLKRELAEAEASLAKAREFAESARAKCHTLQDADEQAVIDTMSGAELINRKVRENAQRTDTAKRLAEREKSYEAVSAEIDAIEAQKKSALESAKFPVPGLSFDESGVLVNGVPFKQASAAEQVKVSVAMAAAMNPKLRVMLIRDGSLLDEASMAVIVKLAEEQNMQIWLEKVSTGDECSVVISDGEVAPRTGVGSHQQDRVAATV